MHGWSVVLTTPEQIAAIRNGPHGPGVAVLLDEIEQLLAALGPFAKFGQYVKDHPRHGLDDLLYSWDCGGSGIRKSDLLIAAELLKHEDQNS